MSEDSELLKKMAKRWLSWSDAERESFSSEVPPVAKEVSEETDRLLPANLRGASVQIDNPEES